MDQQKKRCGIYALPNSQGQRGCIKHTTQICSVLISIDPNAATPLYSSIRGRQCVCYKMIFWKLKLTNAPRLFSSNSVGGIGGGISQSSRAQALWSDWRSSDCSSTLHWSWSSLFQFVIYLIGWKKLMQGNVLGTVSGTF